MYLTPIPPDHTDGCLFVGFRAGRRESCSPTNDASIVPEMDQRGL